MKTKKTLFVFLALAFAIGSCSKVTDMADVTFNTEFKADLDCEVPSGSFKLGSNGIFAASETIDPLADTTVEKYIDKIKAWEITGISGEILSVSKAGVNLLDADLEVFSENHVASWHIPTTPLIAGQEIELDNSDGQWDTINLILGEKQEFTVSVNGETDEDDVTFVIRVIMKSKVTANPL